VSENRPERHERVADRARVLTLGEQSVDKVLQVGPANVSEANGSEVGENPEAHGSLVGT
jgi:hypothetical protein